jgi:dTDP-4-amino-4,6-dideoxygalactose transaminase
MEVPELILMNDFRAEPPELREAMTTAARGVLDSGWYVLGERLIEFEAAWAAACGVREGVGVGNGMDAIEIALRALGIGPGDEVITTPMTAFATVLAVLRAGATPVLADISADSALMDLASVARCLSSRTRAVLLVHLYGQLPDMPSWSAFCEANRVALIEDCAQAHGASLGGRVAGSFGAAGAYSFYPTKNLGAAGDGGMLVTKDEDVAARARRLRNYGQSERYHHPELGLNSRLDEIHAAMLLQRMRWLPQFTQRRREVAAVYDATIRNADVELMAPPVEEQSHVHHLYVLRSSHRERLAEHLRAQGVQSLIHYPVPIHFQPPCRDLRRDPQGLAASERHAAQCLSIPCHPQMDLADAQAVAAAVNGFRPA